MQNDPDNFPDPELFDPERHSKENKSQIKSGSLIQFGLGPRQCLGMKIAQQESKILIYQMLRNYRWFG